MKRILEINTRPSRGGAMWVLVTLLALAPVAALAAEVEDVSKELTPPRPRPDAAELRQRARLLSPEERQRLMRESLGRRGVTNWAEWQQRREEFRNLTPEQREARMREVRQRPESIGPGFRVLTPDERESKRRELRQRVDAQIKVLRGKQVDGTLNEVEARRLERMVEMSKGLEQGTVLGPRGLRRLPGRAGEDGGKPTDALPPPAISPQAPKPPPPPGA